jgi:hypothetical protein
LNAVLYGKKKAARNAARYSGEPSKTRGEELKVCRPDGHLAIEAALDLFARLIEMLAERGMLDHTDLRELAEIAGRHAIAALHERE